MSEKKQAEFVKWMGPILDCLRDLGGQAKPREVTDWIAEKYAIPQNVRGEVSPKTGQERFYNRVAWARQYLVWEGLLDGTHHGVWVLTPRGAKTHLTELVARGIFKKWVAIHSSRRKSAEAATPVSEPAADAAIAAPPEAAEDAQLLHVLQKLSPQGFERVCQRLLRASGFEKVSVTGRSHDGGIDGVGILLVNPFVSFKVLFQCKRYKGSVSRAQVGDFRNAMIGRADKGIILTTGTFTLEARKEAERDGAPPVELVDGEKLVAMFESLQLGMKPKTVYEVDLEFFEQFKT